MSFIEEVKREYGGLTIVGKPLIIFWCAGTALLALSDKADVVIPKIGMFFHKLFFKK